MFFGGRREDILIRANFDLLAKIYEGFSKHIEASRLCSHGEALRVSVTSVQTMLMITPSEIGSLLMSSTLPRGC